MKSKKKTILIAALVGILTGIISVMSTPNLPQSCKDFRDLMQQLAYNDSGLAGVIAVFQEDAMEHALADRYGSMTAEQCTERSRPLKDELDALGHTKWVSQMAQADADVKQAMKDCHDKRVSGALKTHEESAQCSNPRIAAAFDRIGYPYKDLVAKFTDKRMELAKKLDKDDPNGSMKDSDFAPLALEIAEEEGARVKAGK